jgi:hypothetical protein
MGLAAYLDVFNLESILQLNALTLCGIGVLTLSFSGICFHLLGSKRASEFCLGFGRQTKQLPAQISLLRLKSWAIVLAENRGKPAWDLPLSLQKALMVPAILCISIMLVNSRSLRLLSDIPKLLEPSPNEFCPRDDELSELDQEQTPPGCELVIRAYELGYADSLGDCKPKKPGGAEGDICRRRHYDEPFFHYAYRKMKRFYTESFQPVIQGRVDQEWARFQDRTKQLKDLARSQTLSMQASPHASHHVFTNMPRPEQSIQQHVLDIIQINSCLQKYTEMPHTLPADGESEPGDQFDFAYGHLLFSQRHEAAAGYCPEYTVHWEMPEDTCQNLAANPESALTDMGVWSEVESVMDRKTIEQRLALEGQEENRPTRLASLLSFQCIWAMDKEPELNTYDVKIGEESIKIAEMGIARQNLTAGQKIPKALFHRLATTLLPHFSYSSFLSNQSLDLGSEDHIAQSFAQSSRAPLTRLELLRKADIMLGHEWLQEHPGLIEIYPWHLHLYNFVESFRREYRNSRGRL